MGSSPPRSNVLGRAEVLERIERELLAGTRVLTILGPPGIGKTCVANASRDHFAAAAAFAGGTYLCDLSEAVTEHDLLFTVLSLLDAKQPRLHLAHDDLKTRLVEVLEALGPALLVLDNFEQLAAFSRHLETWCSAAPRLALLVTSRERLAVRDEVILELPPLLEEDAVRLFASRASAAGGDAGGDPLALGDIVRRLDGNPLAIELAAARTRLFSVAELLRRLDEGQHVLASGRTTKRHASVESAIDWSWNLLGGVEQRALAGCSVFAGSFTVAAAESVVRSSVDVLASLRDKSLLRATEDGRLAMFVSIREYAAKKRMELGPDEDMGDRLRHARYYAKTARQTEDAGLREDIVPKPAQADLLREKENLIAALAFARSLPASIEASLLQRDLAIGAAKIHALPGDDCIAALSSALAALRTNEGHAVDVASALLARRAVWSALGRHDQCLRDLDEVRSTSGVPAPLRARALIFRGTAERYYGDVAKAVASHEEAARELRSLDLPRASAMNDVCRGRLQCDLRNRAAAYELNERAFDASDVIGDVLLASLARANLAQLEQEDGHFDRADELLRRALGTLRSIGEVDYVSIYTGVLADLLFERGLWDDAGRAYADATHHLRPLVADRQMGIINAAAAALEATRGDFAAATRYIEAARRSFSRSKNPVLGQVLDNHRGTLEVLRASEEERRRLVTLWRVRLESCRATELGMSSMDVRFSCRILERTLSVDASLDRKKPLRLARDASWFVGTDGRRIDLVRRGALRRIVDVMCVQQERHPGRALVLDDLVDAGWPGERVLAEAAATRVRVAISTLRRLGLKDVILTRDDGYLIDPSLRIERS